MMRVVFLLFAEERGLLPQGALFTRGYGISDELDDARRARREEGSEALDATHLTWHRLLATSQALYRGATFEDMRLPSYGGSLFDPARFPFLTARDEHGTLAVTVTDRVMLEVLRAVQVARLRGQPARRISFRDIDVEQIGYIYEGLLGYTCARRRRDAPSACIGKEGEEPEIPLATLEALRRPSRPTPPSPTRSSPGSKEDQPAATPPTKAALAKAHQRQSGPSRGRRTRRCAPSTTDQALRDRLRPFIGIIRRDLRDRPLVVLAAAVCSWSRRPSRATAGAHYTPQVARRGRRPVRPRTAGLRPGPAPERRTAGCRSTPTASSTSRSPTSPAARARSWSPPPATSPTGSSRPGSGEKAVDRHAAARAEDCTRSARSSPSCLYGADINAMAVEMCKLSLWLVSLDPKLPFSFVDDKILHGNSLLGLTDVAPAQAPAHRPRRRWRVEQAEHLRARRGRRAQAGQATPPATRHRGQRQRPAALRHRQAAAVAGRTRQLTAQLADIADGVIAAGLRLGGKPGKALNDAYENLASRSARPTRPTSASQTGPCSTTIINGGLTPTVDTDYERWKPLHWILAVPDVMERGGFDAIIGNPPFLGGQKLTGAHGYQRPRLARQHPCGRRRGQRRPGRLLLPARDVAAYRAGQPRPDRDEHHRARRHPGGRARPDGRRTDSRSPARSRADRGQPPVPTWNTQRCGAREAESAASVPRVADDVAVERISTCSNLRPGGRRSEPAYREHRASHFMAATSSAWASSWTLTKRRPGSRPIRSNAEVLFPYLNGEDLNSRPDSSRSRWVIDFNDRSEAEAKMYRTSIPARSRSSEAGAREVTAKGSAESSGGGSTRTRPAMRKAIAELDEMLVIARVSKTVMPVRVRPARCSATCCRLRDGLVCRSGRAVVKHAPDVGDQVRVNDARPIRATRLRMCSRPSRAQSRPSRLAEIGRTLDTRAARDHAAPRPRPDQALQPGQRPRHRRLGGPGRRAAAARSTSSSTTRSWTPTAGATWSSTTASTPTGR